MKSLLSPPVSNRIQSTLNNHTKNMPALSWGASSVSNLKSWAQNPVQRKPSESIHDQDLCLMETVSGLVAELKIHVEKIDESTGKSEVQSKESLSPNIFFGCLWISVEPIRRFRKKTTGPTSSSFARRICSPNLANSVIIPLKWHELAL